MSVPTSATETRAASQELARALRSGLDLRWSIPAPSLHLPKPFPPHGNVRAFLEPYADSLEFPIPRARHPLHRLIRVVRALLRKIISPWLLLQSNFNLSTVSLLEQVEQRVRDLEESEANLRRTVETLEKKLASRADSELEKR
jgi:hypothetical protein